VNAEQASKRVTQEPTRLRFGEGRRRWEYIFDALPDSLKGIALRGDVEQALIDDGTDRRGASRGLSTARRARE